MRFFLNIEIVSIFVLLLSREDKQGQKNESKSVELMSECTTGTYLIDAEKKKGKVDLGGIWIQNVTTDDLSLCIFPSRPTILPASYTVGGKTE